MSMMRSVAILILHAFVVRIHARELELNPTVQEFTDMSVNKLVDTMVDNLHGRRLAAVPQASRPTILGRTRPSGFLAPWAASKTRPLHLRGGVVPNAVMAKESSKQPLLSLPENNMADWPMKYRSLSKRGLKSVTAQEALKMTKSPFFPAKLVDVRLDGQFVNGHPQGAINLPLRQIVQGNSIVDLSKKFIGYSSGVQPTESNPQFQADALKQLNKNQPIIIVDDRGGTVENIEKDKDAMMPLRYTASLKAASALYDLGFKNIRFLEGGINSWFGEGLPTEKIDVPITKQIATYAPQIGAVVWIPAQFGLYLALVPFLRSSGLVN